ncbi:MAG: NADH-quinone oxidoreductase subunit J [bacterium]
MTLHLVLYCLFFAMAAVSAVCVVTSKNTVHSALFLVVTMVALAGNFLLMHQELMAVIQVFVYAGAIMVLFLFVIMLLNLREPDSLPSDFKGRTFLGVALTVVFVGLIGFGVLISRWDVGVSVNDAKAVSMEQQTGGQNLEAGMTEDADEGAKEPASDAGTRSVFYPFANRLLVDYLLPFELMSILLLVAMVGAVVVSRRMLPKG